MMHAHSPAFPHHEDCLSGTSSGMSLRDYFVSHAPTEPQPWFEPVMPPKPKLGQEFISLDGERKYTDVRTAYIEEGRFGYEDVNKTAVEEWDVEWNKQRYFQWPEAWADARLARRINP